MIKYLHKHSTILFVGINPHHGSFERGIPFSNNKLFWYLLSDAGLINETRAELRDDASLRRMYKTKFNAVYKLGFVNIIDRPTRDVSELVRGEELPGRKRLSQILRADPPIVACFIGKVTYEKYVRSKDFSFGWQPNIGDTQVFVMHAPLRGEAIVRVKELRKVKRHSAEHVRRLELTESFTPGTNDRSREMNVVVKRIYEKPSRKDGARVLVDRLWPRGVSKENAKLDLWLKEIAPSTELRKWFDHDPKKWVGFQRKYRAELAKNKESVAELKEIAKQKKSLTILYGAKDEEHNEALVIKDFISRKRT